MGIEPTTSRQAAKKNIKINRGCGGLIPQPHGLCKMYWENLMKKNKRGCGGLIPQPLGKVKGDFKEKYKGGMVMLGFDLGSQCYVDKK